MPDIELHLITPDPDNVRVAKPDAEADAELLASVKALGVIQPIVVRPIPEGMGDEVPVPGPGEVPSHPRYMVLVGHRRFAAAQAAGLATIPAEIREGLAEGDVRLIQLAENVAREDMDLVDVWAAVEAAAAAGLADNAIALAMNRSKADIARFRAMGRLHPEVQDHIRETGDVPQDHLMRTICQAPYDKQASAFREGRAQDYGGTNLWWWMAKALAVRRIPLATARFDRKIYTGPVFSDLFAEQEEAEDVEAFLDLQEQWVDDQLGLRVKEGWHDAVKLEATEYRGWKTPKGCKEYGSRPIPKPLPKKADRKGAVYAVGLRETGEVEEFIWLLSPPKEKREAPALGVPPKPKAPEAGMLTQKGVELLETHKRRHFAEALAPEAEAARTAHELVPILAALLTEHAKYRYGSARNAPRFDHLLREDGSVELEGRLPDWIEYARDLAGFMALDRDSTRLSTVELLGAFIGAHVAYPADGEALAAVKGPGLKAIASALEKKNLGLGQHSTQRALREAIGKRLTAIGPEHLPGVGWKVGPKKAAPETRLIGGGEDEQDEGLEDIDDLGPEHADMDFREAHA